MFNKLISPFLIITSILILFISSIIFFTKPPPATISIREIATIDSQELLLKTISSDERSGALLMVGIPDTLLTDSTITFLNDNKILGVILLQHNIQNPNQVKKLTSDLREKVDEHLLIAIDQEGGTVIRIPWDEYADVSARTIGNTGDTNYAYTIAKYRSDLLLDLGINVILGPVADIAYTNNSFLYDRSFGSNPDTVSAFVEATVRAQKDAGIITVLKHFPGHGDTTTDSHFSLPVINKSKETLITAEFIPFKAGIDAGAEMVMLGHIVNPQISNNPASIDSIYRQILNEKLGFNGIIITDDLKMSGGIETGIGWGINMLIDSKDKVSDLKSTYQTEDAVLLQIMDML